MQSGKKSSEEHLNCADQTGAVMLEIRKEQIQALAAARCPEYIRSMARMLHEDFPDAFGTIPTEVIERTVSETIAEATTYGVFREPDLTSYIRLQAILGRQFDTNPQHVWVRMILERSDLSGTEKMDLIHEHIVFSQAARG
jgi:hypothetical protein